MKKETKRFIKLFGIMLLSLMLVYLVGCQDKDSNASGNKDKTNDTSQNNDPDNQVDADDEEPFPISIMTTAHNPDPPTNDSPNVKALAEYTNTELDMIYVPASNYEDRFNITLGSGELPTIMLASKSPSFI